jgi:hypothetical protein
MRRVAIDTANIITPVLAPAEVVSLFLARMAGKAGLRGVFRRLVLERNYLERIAFSDMVLTRAMTRFTAGDLALPTTNGGKSGVRRVRKGFELIFVTVFTCVAADVTRVADLRE